MRVAKGGEDMDDIKYMLAWITVLIIFLILH